MDQVGLQKRQIKMPIQKINPSGDSHISCGTYTIGGLPADITTCTIGEPELNYDMSDDAVVGITGAVSSVNGQEGIVVLDPDDLDDSLTTHKFISQTEKNKLGNIEANADVTDATNVAAAGAHMAGGTDIPITDGGTGASSASAARANLGLVIGTNVQAYSSVLANTTASFTTALQTKLNALHNDVKGSVLNANTGQLYEPTSDDGEAYFEAFLNAYSGCNDGDTLDLYPGSEYISNNKYTIAKNITVRANNAIFKRKNATETDWVVEFQASAVTGDYQTEGRGILRVYDLEINGNYENVTATSARGEGIRISGSGQVELINCYAHSSPVGSGIADDAAVNFMVIGSGHKKLVNCRADRPSYANYRIQAATSEFLGCDSLVTEFTGNYGRLFLMDGASVKSCVINGGIWKVTDEMKINANFDPVSNISSKVVGPWCEQLLLTNIIMDFGTQHTDPDGDSFVKFDNIRRVICSNILQTHSEIYNPLNETGFKWWLPGTGVQESLFTVGSLCSSAYFENIIADGWLDLAGSSGGPYTDIVSCKNCEWGVNAHIEFGVENCNHVKQLVIENCSFHNVVGQGTSSTRAVFYNYASNKNQQIRINNCFISTHWSGGNGLIFNKCDRIGDIATTGIDLLDLNTSEYYALYIARVQAASSISGYSSLATYDLEGASGNYDDYITAFSIDSRDRLRASPHIGDPYNALLHRNPVRIYDYTNNQFIDGPAYTLAFGGNNYNNSHFIPQDPGTDDGDWFNMHIMGPQGSRVTNLQCGAGGNGLPLFWQSNISGDMVEDPTVRIY